MAIRVKICGVNSPAAFDAAAEAGADWVGFVFFPRSPRYVSAEEAALLSNRMKGGPDRVGLFVEPSDGEIAAVLDRVRLSALQVYAPPARLAEIATRFAVPVWRSLAVGGAKDLPASAGAETAFVVEPRPPAGAVRPGGNAVTLEWKQLAGWEAPLPWLLAGGLSSANVARALAESGAQAVDVSSGVERAAGIKDARLIATFIRAARDGVIKDSF